MSNIRHILRLHSQAHSKTSIAKETGMQFLRVKKIVNQFAASKLTFQEINELTDDDLNDLFAKYEDPVNERLKILYSLFPDMEKELKKRGVTRKLLWEEYKKKHSNGVGITQFAWHFSEWKARTNPTMKINHKAGDKMYIDFAGERLYVIDKDTGESNPVEVFVAILGASQLTYIEAVRTQQKEDFIPACENALHYYGGVPTAIVPDNLRAAVSKSNRYEPTINETFADFAEHYGTTILPARAYRPRDKALVENAIRIMYTRIYAKIRGTKYYSLDEINNAILIALEEHNNQQLSGKNFSRRQCFEEVEKQTLIPLPEFRYEFKKRFSAHVMKNGHVSLPQDKHYYSVPQKYVGRKVKVMYTRKTVTIFYNYERIAFHQRVREPYSYTTDPEHLGIQHRFVSEWTPHRFIEWADKIHKDVKEYITEILNHKRHPEQAFKMCLGVLNLAKKVGNERLIGACQRASSYGLYNYRTIVSILEKGLDKNPDEENQDLKMPEHDNIRGENYFK